MSDALLSHSPVVSYSFAGAIGVRNRKRAAIGKVQGMAAREIDASGFIVTPGFVDMHPHYDATLSGGELYALLFGWHGVTTVSIGN